MSGLWAARPPLRAWGLAGGSHNPAQAPVYGGGGVLAQTHLCSRCTR